jgi:hypothetical protein
MTISQLKICYPKLYAQVFTRGVMAARKRILNAEFIADSDPVQNRARVPTAFARVPIRVAGRGGPSIVVPTY